MLAANGARFQYSRFLSLLLNENLKVFDTMERATGGSLRNLFYNSGDFLLAKTPNPVTSKEETHIQNSNYITSLS
jgi:hypothetical protein